MVLRAAWTNKHLLFELNIKMFIDLLQTVTTLSFYVSWCFEQLSALRIENLPWRPDIYIENITGEIVAYSRVEVKMNTQGEVYVTERKRSRGVFIENLELQHFPFDVQVNI